MLPIRRSSRTTKGVPPSRFAACVAHSTPVRTTRSERTDIKPSASGHQPVKNCNMDNFSTPDDDLETTIVETQANATRMRDDVADPQHHVAIEKPPAAANNTTDVLAQIVEMNRRILSLQHEVEQQRKESALLRIENRAYERELQKFNRLAADQPPVHAANTAMNSTIVTEPRPARSTSAAGSLFEQTTTTTATTYAVTSHSNASATMQTCAATSQSGATYSAARACGSASSAEFAGFNTPSMGYAATTLASTVAPGMQTSITRVEPNHVSAPMPPYRYGWGVYTHPAQSSAAHTVDAALPSAFTDRDCPVSAADAVTPSAYVPAIGATVNYEQMSSGGYHEPPPAACYVRPASTDLRAPEFRRTHELPQFSGRPEEWPLFICSYQTTTAAYGYSDLENMMRLHKCLTGDARKRVQSILIRPEHVGRVIMLLEKAFGRPELLVDSQISEARRLPRIEDGHLEMLVSFSISVEGLATFLDTAATQHHLANPTLLDELVGKLPLSERLKWATVAQHIRPYPTIKDFAKWLDEVASLIATVLPHQSTTKPSARTGAQPKQPYPRAKHVLLNAEPEVRPEIAAKCVFCMEAHDIRCCDAFLRLTLQERWREVKRHPLCFGCLTKGHMLPSCTRRARCGVDNCQNWHYPALHYISTDARQPDVALQIRGETSEQSRPSQSTSDGASLPPVRTNRRRSARTNLRSSHTARNHASTDAHDVPLADPSAAVAPVILNCREGRDDGLLLFRIVPVVLYGANGRFETYAFLDEGSSISLIDESVAMSLQLPGESSELHMQWFGAQSTVEQSCSVSLSISGIQEDAARFAIDRVRTVKRLTLPMQTVDRSRIVYNRPDLRDVPFAGYADARPKILIGLEHHHLGAPQQIHTSANGIVAALTSLGWVLYGNEGLSAMPGAVVLHVRDADGNETNDERDAQLHELVRQHFTTEMFGVKAPTAPIESDELVRARRILRATTKRVGTHFETGLLWRRDDIVLPDSYSMALQRLTCVEAKMRRDPEYARQYRAQIEGYIQKGYARKMTRDEARHRGDRTWFLPHFAVKSISKPGKFRLVFDAAAAAHGMSLNSALLSGPDENVPLVRLLFRFRLGTIGVCADVREMFHQVLVRRADQDAQRFLWRDGDSSAVPEVFVMVAMTFGSTCSPASAQHVKNVNADEFAEEKPDAAYAIRNNHYVDDFVASFASSEEAVRITADVIEVQKRGGFDLRGVVSNCPAVRAHFGAEGVAPNVNLEPEPTSQKILGMTWETSDDTFRFQTRFGRVRPDVVDGSRRPTKREILSVAMSIFDPFGLLADFVLASKIILQDLWRTNISWDEPVPDSIDKRWQAWRAQVERTRLVRVPRCYSPYIRADPNLQLHIFADASEVAFAAVAFWRIRIADKVELAFVAGKARCAPIKLLSIPRLELQAAVLATRLMVEICECHDLAISKTVLWSDSETVLKWLRCDRRRYKAFVAFRVAEVVESAPASWWRWVPTAMNVADDATRVKEPPHFEPESRWLHGPAWLCEDESQWPVQAAAVDAVDSGDEEVRSRFVGAVAHRGPAIEFERFSKLYKLYRTVAWTLRFVSNARERREQRQFGELRAAEVDRAVEVTSRVVQQEVYADEIAALRSGLQVLPSSSLFVLKPYLDEMGLLRVHGRTDAAEEQYMRSGAKRPVILPPNHWFTMLLVKHHHERLAHQLVDATIAAVRLKFWVPKLRTLVKKVRARCQTCRVNSAAPTRHSLGQLPRDRMDAYARPFTNTGLDFFGPVMVTVGRRREKRWVALFTCMTVRAVHLEIAADLSTEACLLCIRNLCNLRGVPALIRCDNGTNFVGARNELVRETSFFDPTAIQRELTTRGVEWRFNCPGNPEAGGAWERLVQSVKRVLRVTLQEEAPRVETLRSLLLEAANMVNSRPLTHLQVEPCDPEPLTPNHFLMGGPNAAMVPNPEDVEPRATRKQWQICRGLSRQFWRQWVRDYLPEMTRRSRHYPEQTPLRIGDLVVICDGNQPRSHWTRGRIIEVVSAADGEVRTATVQTSEGTLRRPSTKLARIDVGPPRTDRRTGAGMLPT